MFNTRPTNEGREESMKSEKPKASRNAKTHDTEPRKFRAGAKANTATPPRCPCGWTCRHLFLSAFTCTSLEPHLDLPLFSTCLGEYLEP